MTLDGKKLQEVATARMKAMMGQEICATRAAVLEGFVCDLYRLRNDLENAKDIKRALDIVDQLANKCLTGQQEQLARAERSANMAADLTAVLENGVKTEMVRAASVPETMKMTVEEKGDGQDRRSCTR